ncbi:MAG: SIR2 family protein [Gammaproteobacteria bacterium]|nr:SIR2 family protein [Gammaproteobacteria bacterium]
MAFIIGNGINLHYNKGKVSWNDLLLDLWDKYSFNTQSTIPEGISFTEFYDVLEIQNYLEGKFSSILQKDVVQRMSGWDPNDLQNLILNKIKELDAPLLTTNFDDLIPQSMGLDFKKLHDTSFTDYYPWSCYYSDRELSDPNEGFGVWNINGMIKYHRSIKLGLSQYMGNVERARKLIHKKPENISFEGKNQSYWPGYKTWLHTIFNKSLFICGLRLDETEIFIRWLLIERAKYFRRFPDRKHNGWFVMKNGEDKPSNEGKIFFLQSVGFEIISMDEYKYMYEDIWT